MKKGFTLIELLAVIVILAIIAVITVPMLMNVIEKARKGALKDSAYGLIEAANLYYSTNKDNISDYELFEIVDAKQTSINKLSYKGKVDTGKIYLYSDSKIALCIDNGTYYAKESINETEVTIGSGTCGAITESGDFLIISDIASLQLQVNDLQEELASLKSMGTATENDILNGKTAVVTGNLITGTLSSLVDYETIYEYGVSNPYNFIGSNPYNTPLNSGIVVGNFHNSLPINMTDVIGIKVNITYGDYNGIDMGDSYYIGTTENPTTNKTIYYRNIGTMNHILPVINESNKYLAFSYAGYSQIIDSSWRNSTYKINKIELIKG